MKNEKINNIYYIILKNNFKKYFFLFIYLLVINYINHYGIIINYFIDMVIL